MRIVGKLLIPLLTFCFFCLYWIRSTILLDADFGWHIRMGQIILHSGIPVVDVLSYTMPHFPMIDHEWLTNVFLSFSFPILHMWGLAILFVSLSVGSLVLQFQKQMLKSFGGAILFLLTGLSIYSFVGIRPQIISWFLFSVFCLFLLHERWRWGRYFLPLLMVLWVNLHGGFAVGVFLLGVVFVLESYAERRIVKKLFFLFLLVVIASFINPYGIRVWGEIWMQISDNSLRSTITEWMPAIYFSNLAFWIYVFCSVFLVFRYWKGFFKEAFVQFLCFFFFLFMSLMSMRHIPLWIIISAPVTWKGVVFLSKEAKKKQFGLERFQKGLKILFVFLLFILLPQEWGMFQTLYNYSFVKVYPVQSVNYLQSHVSRRIFSLYDWNSFILWQLPKTKVFIDGMMPSWRWTKASREESNYAFLEYQNILRGKISLQAEIQKYSIDGIVLPANATLLDDPATGYSISGLERQVRKIRWRMVYRDETAIVYQP